MKGNNKLTVCQASMIEIVQDWINKEIASKPTVISVKRDDTDSNSRTNVDSFIIQLSDKEGGQS